SFRRSSAVTEGLTSVAHSRYSSVTLRSTRYLAIQRGGNRQSGKNGRGTAAQSISRERPRLALGGIRTGGAAAIRQDTTTGPACLQGRGAVCIFVSDRPNRNAERVRIRGPKLAPVF